jgi:putative ABC transport system permease protein
MSWFTTFALAFRALWRNKVRTLLTMFGIFFGIGAVIAMVAAGMGAQQSVKDVFSSLGTNVLSVVSAGARTFGASGGAGSRASLTWKDFAALRSGDIPTIRWVAPLLSSKNQIASEEGNWNTSVTGTNGIYFSIRNWHTTEGEVFDEDTGESSSKVCVIGTTVAAQLFPNSSPIGQSVRIAGQPYEVIGLLESKGQGPMGDNDDIVLIPYKTYEAKLAKGLAKYVQGQIVVSMVDDDDADVTMAAISDLLREQHKLAPAADDDFTIRNPAEYAKAQLASTTRIAWVMKIVAAISLLVGGIGVMNIMLVSVIERTREIGIRMAVGAKPTDVATQFLVEALTLSALGGVAGLGLGWVGAKIMASVFGWKMFYPTGTAAIAVLVSGGVGVLFGLYPAVRASQLDPITALRYES